MASKAFTGTVEDQGTFAIDLERVDERREREPRQEQKPPSVVEPPHEGGGYPCEFVEKPSQFLQTECSVCLQILREPQIVSCCGYSFCKTCIERIQAKNNPCPLCIESNFTTLHDKRLQRSLSELDVRCVYQSDGCGWVSKLGALDQHLNVNPDPERRLSGCDFIELGCEYCGDLFKRHLIKEHESEQCPKRPFSCDYCRDYESTFEDVANNHWPECKCYPMSCPNECMPYAVERQNLTHHLTSECSHAVIECDFNYVGCEVKLPRKDMSDHIRENSLSHISLLAAQNQKLAAKIVEKDEQTAMIVGNMEARMEVTISKLKNELEDRFEHEHAAVMAENMALKVELQQLRRNQEESSNASLARKVDNLKINLQDHETRTSAEIKLRREEIAALQSHIGVVPTEFIMPKFEIRRQTGEQWNSKPFYTHPQGYKMRLMVDANRNGEGTYISVFVILVSGEFDDCLKWPFRGSITIQLLEQEGANRHHSEIIEFTDNTPNAVASRPCFTRSHIQGHRAVVRRRTVTENAIAENTGWGNPKFLSYRKLTPIYLKNDCLRFRIC